MSLCATSLVIKLFGEKGYVAVYQKAERGGSFRAKCVHFFF